VVHERVDLRAGAQGPAGAEGAAGPKGDSGLTGAFYATAVYNAGDANSGAIATVACDAESADFSALAGGVQEHGVHGGEEGRQWYIGFNLSRKFY
jgi:hypothetical protein